MWILPWPGFKADLCKCRLVDTCLPGPDLLFEEEIEPLRQSHRLIVEQAGFVPFFCEHSLDDMPSSVHWKRQ